MFGLLIFILILAVLFVLKVLVISTIFAEEISTVQKRDPAARSIWEIVVLYQGLHALIHHRIAH